MKNLMMQHYNGTMKELELKSMANIQAYAKLIGAEYKLIEGKPFDENLANETQKVHMIHEEFDEWDNICMVDIDKFTPVGMTDNVFDWSGIGLYEPIQQGLHRTLARRFPHLCSVESPYWGGAIYKMSRKVRRALRVGLDGNRDWTYTHPFVDEGVMSTLAFRAGFKTNAPGMIIDKRWCQCSYLPNPQNAKFIHIRTKITPQGPKRTKLENYKELVERGIIE